MPINQRTPNSVINAHLQLEIEKIEKVLINVLNRVGLQCIAEARNRGSYIDRTGNLRSSIGYTILQNGKTIKKAVFSGKGSEGKKEGSQFIEGLNAKYPSGIVLIVVAGMEYAAYVETKRNVLASSELLGEKLVPQLLSKIGFKRK